MRIGRAWVIWGALPVLTAACAPYEANVTVGAPRPSPRPPFTERESKLGDPAANASVDGTSVNVVATRAQWCRAITTTPMVADKTTKQTITTTGVYYQLAWAGGAALAAFAGGAAAFGDCEVEEEDKSNPNADPITRPCTDSEKIDRRNTGYVLFGISGALLVPFVVNAARGGTDSTTVKAAPIVSPGQWQTCGNEDLEGTPVELVFADGQVIRKALDSRGRARLDLGALGPSDGVMADPVATIRILGRDAGTVSLRGSEFLARHESQRSEAREADAKERVERKRKNRAAWDNSVIDAAEKEVVRLEHRPGWTMKEVDAFIKALGELTALVDSHKNEGIPMDARVEARLGDLFARAKRLHPRVNAAVAEEKRRVKEEAARLVRQAKKMCVPCCLKSFVAATRDHCAEKCEENTFSYVNEWGSCR